MGQEPRGGKVLVVPRCQAPSVDHLYVRAAILILARDKRLKIRVEDGGRRSVRAQMGAGGREVGAG